MLYNVNININIITIYKFYFRHLSVWFLYNRIKGQGFCGFLQCANGSGIRFAAIDEIKWRMSELPTAVDISTLHTYQ